MGTYLGIDIGTSGCKALALSDDGKILARHTVTYGISSPKPDWNEQNPSDWLRGVKKAVGVVLTVVPADHIQCIGLTGQMHGLTPIDQNGNVIRPAILWNDQRNKVESDKITELAGGLKSLLAMVNNRMLVGYTGGKILWMENHEPSFFEQIRYVLNPKDYLRLVLTGEVATEVSDASGTGLFDVANRQWSNELIDKLPFDRAILPKCFESSVITGKVSVSAANEFGLRSGTPVIGGGGDAVVQTLGSGVVSPGELQTTIGTAGILAATLDELVKNLDGRIQIFCNLSSDTWHAMGVSINAGGAINWLHDIVSFYFDKNQLTHAQIASSAEKSKAGASGLLFLPYLNGERCPHSDPKARAAFIGLNARHQTHDLVRAVMEGVVFALYDMYTVMQQMKIKGKSIRASGGGVQSSLWRQIQADLFNYPVMTTTGAAEGAAFGAALLAGIGVGNWSSLKEASKYCKALTIERPNREDGRIYQQNYQLYQKLYPMLTDTFNQLSQQN